MAKLYTILFSFLFPLLVMAAEPGTPGNPTNPDSLAMIDVDGHARCTTHVKINCTTRTLTLSAHQDLLFTGTSEDITPLWSTGQTVHSITVTPPGSWTWDATGLTCDHLSMAVSYDESFFTGQINITGPPGICAGNDNVELNVSTGGYNFEIFNWNPANSNLTPITVDEPGLYTLTVQDAFFCPFSDN